MYLVFDIGGSKTRLAVSSDGKTLGEVKIVPTPKDFLEGIKVIKQIADELSNGEKFESVGGGIAVVFDKQKIKSIHTSHLHGWVNKPIKETLEAHFQTPVKLDNDAALAGLGEATLGAGQGYKIVAYLTISTGVGGGRVVEGKIDENALGFEPGHQIIVPDGDQCNCGGKGHLEVYVGGFYLEKKHGEKSENIKDPKVWDEVVKYLSLGLNNVTVFWSPDIIVLGGSVMQSIPIDNLTSALRDVLTIFPNPPLISQSKLGELGGLYGALALLNPKT